MLMILISTIAVILASFLVTVALVTLGLWLISIIGSLTMPSIVVILCVSVVVYVVAFVFTWSVKEQED